MLDPKNPEIKYVYDDKGNVIDVVKETPEDKEERAKRMSVDAKARKKAEKAAEEEIEAEVLVNDGFAYTTRLETVKDIDILIKELVRGSVHASKGGTQGGLRKTEGFMKVVAALRGLRENDYTDLQGRVDGLLNRVEELEDSVAQAADLLEKKNEEIRQLKRTFAQNGLLSVA